MSQRIFKRVKSVGTFNRGLAKLSLSEEGMWWVQPLASKHTGCFILQSKKMTFKSRNSGLYCILYQYIHSFLFPEVLWKKEAKCMP